MCDGENIRAVEALGIDLMGFIFWPRSSRYVAERPAYLPIKCKRVGVFVDADTDTIRRTVDAFALDIIQLHGSESPAMIRNLRATLDPGIQFIKAISVGGCDDIATYKYYEGCVDYFLFDTKCQTAGGSGQQFEWSVLDAYDGEKPFLLSGGIGPDDAERIKAFHHPKCIGIDLNSRFEIEPGIKDIVKLKTFLNYGKQD